MTQKLVENEWFGEGEDLFRVVEELGKEVSRELFTNIVKTGRGEREEFTEELWNLNIKKENYQRELGKLWKLDVGIYLLILREMRTRIVTCLFNN
jgi:hypothetical protein